MSNQMKKLMSCEVKIEPLETDLRFMLNKKKIKIRAPTNNSTKHNTSSLNHALSGPSTPHCSQTNTMHEQTESNEASNVDISDNISVDSNKLLIAEDQLLAEMDDMSVLSHNINEDLLLNGIDGDFQLACDNFESTKDNVQQDHTDAERFSDDDDAGSDRFDAVSIVFHDEFDDEQSVVLNKCKSPAKNSSYVDPVAGQKRNQNEEVNSKVSSWKDKCSNHFKIPAPGKSEQMKPMQPIANENLINIFNERNLSPGQKESLQNHNFRKISPMLQPQLTAPQQAFVRPLPPVPLFNGEVNIINTDRNQRHPNQFGKNRNGYIRKHDNNIPPAVCQAYWLLGVCNYPKTCKFRHENKNSSLRNAKNHTKNENYRYNDRHTNNQCNGGSPIKSMPIHHECPKGYCYDFWQHNRCSRKKCPYIHTNSNSMSHTGLIIGQQNQVVEQNNNHIFLPSSRNMVENRNVDSRSSLTTANELKHRNLNELLEEAQHLTNIDRSWMIIQHLRQLMSSPSFIKIDEQKFRHAIEHTLLCLKDNATPENVEIAKQLVQMKRSMMQLKWEDLFIYGQVLANVGRVSETVDVLQELYETFDRNRFDWNDMEKLLFLCIEKNGIILKIWDHIKNRVVGCERLVDKLFATVDTTSLQTKMKAESLSYVCKKMMDGNLVLSNEARNIFLKLFTPISSLHQLIELLHTWSDLSVVPVVTLEKFLLSMQTESAVVPICLILERLPLTLCASSSSSFNELLVILCKRGFQYFDVTEKIYNLMRKAVIKPTEESMLHILNMLCEYKNYNLFKSRYDEMVEVGVDPSDSVIPDWFATTLTDALDTTPDEVNILYKMVVCLLSSKIPPEEEKLSKVLNLLIVKRRFTDILALVTKCLERSVLLSQKELRRVVFSLEEWTANTQASIFVYTKMREIYPRPEHQCTCGKRLRSSRSRSNYSSAAAYVRNSDEEVSDAGSAFGDEQEMTSPPSYHHDLLRISAELNENGKNRSKFKELYMEAVSLGAGNDDAILQGLFLGLTDNERAGYEFNIFTRLLTQAYNTDSEADQEIPEDVALALGRLAVRMIKYLHNRESYSEEAYIILHTCHEHAISYSSSGDHFGTMMETSEDMSMCEIANLCADVCICNNKPESGYHVLKHCQYGVPEENVEYPETEQSERNNRAGRLIEGLLQIRMAVEAWEIYKNVHSTMSIPVKTKLVNEICTSFCELNLFQEALEVSDIMTKSQLDFHKKTVKTFVNCLALNQHNAQAMEMFRKGFAAQVYDRTYKPERPYTVELTTDLSRVEIRFILESHFAEMRLEPSYEEEYNKYGIMMDVNHPFTLVIVPASDQDMVEFSASKERTYQDLTAFVNDFNPPLDIIDQAEQRVSISHVSIRRWLSYHPTSNNKLPDNTAGVLNRSTINDGTLSLPAKKKRKIAIPEASFYESVGFANMKMTICPTPKPFDTTEECPSEVASEAPIVTAVPTRRNVLIKDYPATQDEDEAEKYIRKTICAELTALMKKGVITEQSFAPIARKLHKYFICQLRNRGLLHFDKNISLEASAFVANKFADGSYNA